MEGGRERMRHARTKKEGTMAETVNIHLSNLYAGRRSLARAGGRGAFV